MDDLPIDHILRRAEQGDPSSQFLMSQVYLQQGKFDLMRHWLQKAHDAGVPEALDALGHIHEKGHGTQRNYDAALAYYQEAIASGVTQAAYRKAELLFKSRNAIRHEDEIRKLLAGAAQSGFAPALRALGFIALQQGNRQDLAADCFRRSALQGDAVSAFLLAWCLLQAGPGNDAEGRAAYWLQRAAEAQFPYAASLLAGLEGVTPLVPSSPLPPAAHAIELAAGLPLLPGPVDAVHTVLNEDPPVVVYDNVLSLADCAYLIFLSRPYLKRATVIEPRGNERGQLSDVRTNMSTYLPFEVVDFIGRCIEWKIVRATGEDMAVSEPMSILRYAPGEYYKPHVDYFNPKLDVSEKLLRDGGQRTASAVTYLSTPQEGGETRFPRLGTSVPAILGNTLWFRNSDDNGQIVERSLHAGETVLQGEKWVVTKWFRQRETTYLEF